MSMGGGTVLLMVALVLLALGVVLLVRRGSAAGAVELVHVPPRQPIALADLAPPNLNKAGRAEAAEVKRKIEASVWQVLMIPGEGGATGFAYTVGLWKLYQHPEILVFSPSGDPSGVVGCLQAIAARIQRDEKFEAGQSYPNLFGTFAGAFRAIQPAWYAAHLGVAGEVYGGWSFPALQLLWPDEEGRFPGESLFSRALFPRQPLLNEANLVLANLPDSELTYLEQQEGLDEARAAIGELLAEIPAEERGALLEDWLWKAGPGAKLLAVTVFGDLVVTGPKGGVRLLDTGRAEIHEAGAREQDWVRFAARNPEVVFHAPVLLHLRALDARLQPGYVYSWIQAPFLGGEESANNVNFIPATVHVSHSGRLAQSVARLPAGTPPASVDFTAQGP